MWITDTRSDVFEFSLDEMDALTDLMDVQSWPVVLGLGMRQPTIAARRESIENGRRSLADRGLVAEGEAIDAVVLAVRTMTRPEVEVEIRFTGHEGSTLRRATICRRGALNYCVLRSGDDVTVQSTEILSTEMLAAHVADIIGEHQPVDIRGISAPTDELVARLDECHSAPDVAQALHVLGATQADTTAAALAFADCTANVEVVAYELVGGTPTQAAGAVAIYLSSRGAMVTSPSQSSDGRLWTTISPGSSHRIRQAVARLVEALPTGRWIP